MINISSKTMKAPRYDEYHTIPLDILDELAARFILPLPVSEREDPTRVCFAVEEAHWFYQKYYMPWNNELEKGTMMEFAGHMFRHVPFLVEHSKWVKEVVEDWMEYKLTIPTYGAIILNPRLDKVLLVQSFSGKARWGFPKGKVNEGEEPHLCAVREVMEEVGYNVKNIIIKDRYIEKVVNDQTVRLYIVTGVSEETKFTQLCHWEIKNIKWFPLMSLPTSLKDKGCRKRIGMNTRAMFLVIPFVTDLKDWVEKEKANDLVKYCQRIFLDGSQNKSLDKLPQEPNSPVYDRAKNEYCLCQK